VLRLINQVSQKDNHTSKILKKSENNAIGTFRVKEWVNFFDPPEVAFLALMMVYAKKAISGGSGKLTYFFTRNIPIGY